MRLNRRKEKKEREEKREEKCYWFVVWITFSFHTHPYTVVWVFLLMKRRDNSNKAMSTAAASSINTKRKKQKGWRNPTIYWIRPGQTNLGGILKLSEEWKENFHMSKESFYETLLWTPTIYWKYIWPYIRQYLLNVELSQRYTI